MSKFRSLAVALAMLSAAPLSAQVPDDVARPGLLAGWREDGGRHVAGLSIRLAPGWKTYWRAPGDGGIPPAFNWSGSSNVAAVDVHYPVPHVFYQNGMRSIGYKDHVVFPLLIETNDPDAPIRLRGEVELGVCEEICIPVTFRLSADLAAAGTTDAALRAALADRPADGASMECEIAPISDGLRVNVVTEMAQMGEDEVAVVEAGEAGLWVSEASVSRDGGTLSAEVEMVPPSGQPFALARSDVRLTVLSQGRAVEVVGCE